jgi:HAD superfamily hydrolase (TIGR01509 family)
MPRPAACLFDLDGLLLDTEPLHSQAWQQATEHFGLSLELEQLMALRGRRRLDCADQVRHWLASAGLKVPSAEALLAVRQPIAARLLPAARPIDGAVELIQTCGDQRIPMAMVTSSSRLAVAVKEAPHPWLAAIELRIHGDDPELTAGKPAPAPYLLAAQRLGVEAGSCWAFEDSSAGARSALDAGCLVHVLLPIDRAQAAALKAELPSHCQMLASLRQVRLD